ncbi:hypothetical protein [Burkholderia stagnalis]|uniref:hypothetical protein n=1 Tax=Burkholderia stagnalis TaxID=1503054 RepID=UPI0018C8A415|nr:hypothetical protein [Burkholderia stagnalis]
MRFSIDVSTTRRRGAKPCECRVAKWVSNDAMQVTSKNNHKKFGNIWGCFRVKYRTGTHPPSGGKAARTTARMARAVENAAPRQPIRADPRQSGGYFFFT